MRTIVRFIKMTTGAVIMTLLIIIGVITLLVGVHALSQSTSWQDFAFTFLAMCLFLSLSIFGARASYRLMTHDTDTRYASSISVNIPSNDPLYCAIKSVVQHHIHTLSLERRKRLIPDRYGLVNASSWHSEVMFFIHRVGMPYVSGSVSLSSFNKSSRRLYKQLRRHFHIDDPSQAVPMLFREVIEIEIATHEQRHAESGLFSGYSTATEFEHWCATQLQTAGWSASVTGQSGDQGVDVRAVRNGVVLVVQCTFYSEPVGNSAVQQIVAEKIFYGADVAAVVSTAGYTAAARALAKQADVRLLLPGELVAAFRSPWIGSEGARGIQSRASADEG